MGHCAWGSAVRLAPEKPHFKGHHHFLDLALIAEVEGQKVRPSANAVVAVTFEEEESGETI